jgi:hypothetical protein
VILQANQRDEKTSIHDCSGKPLFDTLSEPNFMEFPGKFSKIVGI